MAESSRPETVIAGGQMLSDAVEGERAERLHGEVSQFEAQTQLERYSSKSSNKYDSAHSHASALKILESASHPPSHQLSRVKHSSHADTEQKSFHGSSCAIARASTKSNKGSISGSDADEEYQDASEGPSDGSRGKSRRGCRPGSASSIRSKREPEVGIRCHCPFNHHRVSQLYLSATSNDATIEPPKDVQDHFDSCIWRGCIDHALTVNPVVRERLPSLAPTDEEQPDSEEETSSSASDGVSQHDADADPEAALPVTEKQPPPKRRQAYLRILFWAIVWIVLFIVCCTVIAQHQTPNRTVSLSSKQENVTTKVQDQRVEKWHNFSHEQVYTYTFPRFTKERYDFLLTNLTTPNSTVENHTTQAQPAHLKDIVEKPWHQALSARTIILPTNLTVVLNVTTTHALDLTSLCPPIKTAPKPKPELVLISYQQNYESKSVVFVNNLLACLWFLPLWLLSQKLVEKSHMGWLAENEARTRVRIAAVVVTVLVAAGLALGTDVAVRQIVERAKG